MKPLLIILIVLISVSVSQATQVTLVAGLSLPPYIIYETGNGMEHDIVKEALSAKGYSLELKYVPFARVIVDYKKYDGAVTVNESTGVKGYFSDVVITYQNYAITLKDQNIVIDCLDDLAGKRVVAFQNATKYLGPEYKKTMESLSDYIEHDQQVVQVKMLYAGRTDVVVSDINIFKYYRKKVAGVSTRRLPAFHEIFPPTPYKVIFNDPHIRDAFNRGLSELKACGRYQQIIDSYIK